MSDNEYSQEITIVNKRGLHARASARFSREAGPFKAAIEVTKDATTVAGTSIMGLMMLGAAKGETIKISARGVEAEKAVEHLCALVDNKFDEGE